MFTGLIQEVGFIKSSKALGKGLELDIATSVAFAKTIAIGDSIAVNGACMTATKKTSRSFTIQLLEESLKKTNLSQVKKGAHVNLESSLRLGDKLGGHFVTGHVDEMGRLISLNNEGKFAVLKMGYSKKYEKNLIPKGSISIDGISLTLVDITSTFFTCHIIPHTIQNTILQHKKAGDKINLEYDMLGKFVLNLSYTKK